MTISWIKCGLVVIYKAVFESKKNKSLFAFCAMFTLGLSIASAKGNDSSEFFVDEDSGLKIPKHLEGKSSVVKTSAGTYNEYIEFSDEDYVKRAMDDARDNHISKLIYVNRCEGGCVINPGVNDARSNLSRIVPSTSSISEFSSSDDVFDQVIECLKDVYAPYDVQIVTEDPGDQFHHEAIMAGLPSEIGREANVGGVGGAAGECTPGNNAISFTFANTSFNENDVEGLCWTVAQESAHSFGLGSHTFSCHDPMTYNDGCSRKYFRNINLACAEPNSAAGGRFDEIPQCRCGGNLRNNHVALTSVFGRSDVAIPPPTLDLIGPNDGASVDDNFAVLAESQSDRGVHKVELWLSGTKVDTQDGNLESPSDPSRKIDTIFSSGDWPDGYIDVEVRSYIDLGEYSSQSARVLKGEACTSNDSCLDGQTCEDGGCRFPAADVSLGGVCSIDENCLEGVCGENNGERVCSEMCITSIADSCPEGFECVGSGFCWPASGDDGGCCSTVSTSTDKSSRTGLFLLFALFALAVGWRRKRLS